MEILYTNSFELFLNSLNIKLKIINKTKHSDFHSLSISNHISELDPIILYYLFEKYNVKYRFICSNHLQYIPIIGILGYIENTIYIDRQNHTQSIKTINEEVEKDDFICIFPEGTLYYKPMIKKSNDLCKKLNIPDFKNVLCPKLNGYNEIVKILKPKMITDITLHYIYSNKSKYIPKNSNDALTILQLMNYPPKKIVIIIQEKSIIDTNIMSIFREKDKEMDDYLSLL